MYSLSHPFILPCFLIFSILFYYYFSEFSLIHSLIHSLLFPLSVYPSYFWSIWVLRIETKITLLYLRLFYSISIILRWRSFCRSIRQFSVRNSSSLCHSLAMTSLKLLCTFLAYIFSSNGRATFREELLIRLNPFADEHWFWQNINSICHHFSQILICIGVVCHAQNFAQYKFRIYWSLPFQWERGCGNHLVDDMERRYKD